MVISALGPNPRFVLYLLVGLRTSLVDLQEDTSQCELYLRVLEVPPYRGRCQETICMTQCVPHRKSALT